MKIIVGDTRTHAQAMVRWMKLDPDECVTVAYGDPLHAPTAEIHLIRPLAGPTPAVITWIVDTFQPTEDFLRALAKSWGLDIKPPRKRKALPKPSASTP
jgi:hypothetical protein